MRVEMRKCDCCGKQTEDHYNEIGWIHFNEINFSIHNGRTVSNFSKVESYFGFDEEKDFCSLMCLLRWMYEGRDTKNDDSKIRDFADKFYEEYLALIGE